MKKKGSKEREGKEAPVYDHQLVRTDCNQTKLDLFISSQPTSAPTTTKPSCFTTIESEKPGPSRQQEKRQVERSSVENKENIDTINVEEFVPKSKEPTPKKKNPTHRQPIYLTSVLNLQEEICKSRHEAAVEILREIKFVGVANTRYALVQVKTKLYLFDFNKLSEGLFYQKAIFDFQNLDVFTFSEPAPLIEMLLLALEDEASSWNPDHGTKEELGEFAVQLLVSKRDMLDDYFSIKITQEGALVGLPVLVEQYYPFLHNIPMFLLRLATETKWDSERACFESIAREIATLYAMRPLEMDQQGSTQTQSSQQDPNVPDWKFTVEHILFPQFKSFFIPDLSFTTSGAVLQVADLHQLYKVFERC